MRSLLLLIFRRILWFLNVLLLLDGLEMEDEYSILRDIYRQRSVLLRVPHEFEFSVWRDEGYCSV